MQNADPRFRTTIVEVAQFNANFVRSIVHFKVKKSCPILFGYPRQMIDLYKVNHLICKMLWQQ